MYSDNFDKLHDFEYVRIITELADEIYNDNVPRIKTNDTHPINIAIETCKQKKLENIYITRTYPNGTSEVIPAKSLMNKHDFIIDYMSEFTEDML